MSKLRTEKSYSYFNPKVAFRKLRKNSNRETGYKSKVGYNSVFKYTKWKIHLKFFTQYITKYHLPTVLNNTSHFILPNDTLHDTRHHTEHTMSAQR